MDEIERSGRLRADATQALAAIEERLTEQPPPPPASQLAPQYVNSSQGYQPISSQQKTVRAKLPKLEVKKFNGKLCEWQEFWDSFVSAIHMNDGLSNVDKFSYLRSLLLGSAKSAIGGFALTSANYESAIELLKKRCGKKFAIQRALISELLSELVTNISRDFLTACINIGVEFQSCMISSFGRINDDRL